MVIEDRFLPYPKVELHVHLEGSMRPETILKLRRPADTHIPDSLDGLKAWTRFRSFPHFVEVYVAASGLIRTVDDLETVLTEFLARQAEQNILHTEFTLTASTLQRMTGLSWETQKSVLKRGLAHAESVYGITARAILDIVRGDPPERGLEVAEWAIDGYREGVVCALGLAGEERLGGPEPYRSAIERAREAGVPFVPHAGETEGPEAVASCLEFAPARIGHGVRIVEDGKVMARVRDLGIPLEVCPSSNVALGVVDDLDGHPMPTLLNEGIRLSINSDDPPFFSTSLTDEWARCADAFGFSDDVFFTLTQWAARDALVSEERKAALIREIRDRWPDPEE